MRYEFIGCDSQLGLGGHGVHPSIAMHGQFAIGVHLENIGMVESHSHMVASVGYPKLRLAAPVYWCLAFVVPLFVGMDADVFFDFVVRGHG
jgi:hypothetical protein